MALNLTITNEEKILVTADPRTAGTSENPDGNPAQVDGEVNFEVVDPTVATFERVDEKSGYLVSVDGAEGATQVNVTADADLGEGVTPIADQISLNVTAAGAARLGLAGGAPEPK